MSNHAALIWYLDADDERDRYLSRRVTDAVLEIHLRVAPAAIADLRRLLASCDTTIASYDTMFMSAIVCAASRSLHIGLTTKHR
jgi:hypothetical protein